MLSGGDLGSLMIAEGGEGEDGENSDSTSNKSPGGKSNKS